MRQASSLWPALPVVLPHSRATRLARPSLTARVPHSPLLHAKTGIIAPPVVSACTKHYSIFFDSTSARGVGMQAAAVGFISAFLIALAIGYVMALIDS